MNIILIIVDTLRYDFIGANGNDWIQTPNMDKFAEESWIFDRCFSASYPTIPHRTDLITGKYGSPNQVFNPWLPLRFDVITLPRVLANKDYCTQLIHDTPHLVNSGHNFDWPFHAWTFIRGAEVDRPWIDDRSFTYLENWARDPLFDFVDKKDEVSGYTTVTYTRANRNRKKNEDWNAAKLFLTASDFLKDNKKRNKFFLWIDCFDPHEPWDIPPELVLTYDKTSGYDGRIDPRCFSRQARNMKSVPAELWERVKKRNIALYAGKVSWVDKWLGMLLDTLEETKLKDNTALLLTSDHGTNVGELNLFGKSYPVKEQEGHIPLFLCVPGFGRGRSDLLIQPQDIFATICAIAEAEKPKYIESHDILQLASEGVKNIEGPRKITLAGNPVHFWNKKCERALPVFTVFSGDHYLQFTSKTETSSLYRYGSLKNIASSHEMIVYEMRENAINELEHRRTNPEIIEWLKNNGETPLSQFDFPKPLGSAVNTHAYWRRSYNKW